jgi:hypothetical protein
MGRRWVLPVVVGAVLLICVAPVEDPWIRLIYASDDICDWAVYGRPSCGPVHVLRPLAAVSRYATVVAWIGLWLVPRRLRGPAAGLTLLLGFLPLLYIVFLEVRAAA